MLAQIANAKLPGDEKMLIDLLNVTMFYNSYQRKNAILTYIE